jgi:hypothetical protein
MFFKNAAHRSHCRHLFNSLCTPCRLSGSKAYKGENSLRHSASTSSIGSCSGDDCSPMIQLGAVLAKPGYVVRRNPRSMLFKRIVSLITVGVASSVLLAGCPDPREVAGVGVSGCQREISGATAVTRTETSKLSCASINNLVSSIPSTPDNYLIGSGSPRLYWKCRYHGAEQGSVLLRCEQGKRHFSIVRVAS